MLRTKLMCSSVATLCAIFQWDKTCVTAVTCMLYFFYWLTIIHVTFSLKNNTKVPKERPLRFVVTIIVNVSYAVAIWMQKLLKYQYCNGNCGCGSQIKTLMPLYSTKLFFVAEFSFVRGKFPCQKISFVNI